MLNFLIDECCTPELAAVALARGFRATHVRHIGLGSAPDRKIIPVIVAGDYSFITNNRRDFLRLYAELPLHAGLLIIIPSVSIDHQCRLMLRMLEAIEALSDDIVNRLVEVDAAGNVTVSTYPFKGENI